MSNVQRTETRWHSIEIVNNSNQQSEGGASHSSKFAKFNQQKRANVIFWCQISIFILGATLCILSFSVQSIKRTSIRGFTVWQLCLLITALLGGPLLSRGISTFIIFCIKWEFSAKEDIMYYLIELIESAWVVVYFGLIFLAWTWVVDEPSYLGVEPQNKASILRKFDSTERIITLTLTTILLGSFLWLLKDLLIKIGESSFHIRRFFDRIRESLKHEHRIKALSIRVPDQQSMTACKMFTCKIENVCGREDDRRLDLSSLKDVDEETVSCWAMKLLINEIVKGRPLRFYKDDKVEVMIEDEKAIGDASNVIYHNLGECADVNHLESKLSKYFDQKEPEEVSKWLLEGAESKKVDQEGIKKCLMRAWKFRTSLTRTLQDNKLLFQDLNRFVNLVLVIVIFLVWLVMLNVEIRKAMVVVGSAIVGSAFVLGDFCKKILEDFTFVFLAHPFDVGDFCLIQDTLVRIEKITLLTTTALTLEEEMRDYPNCLLSNSPITNYTRIPAVMGDSIVFSLDIDTIPSINQLKDKIGRYIGENSHYWHQDHELHINLDPKDSTKMNATLHVKHAITYYDYNERQLRKSQLVSELLKYLQELKLVPLSTAPAQQPTPSIPSSSNTVP